MKTKLTILGLLPLLLCSVLHAQSTAFTYQGRLNDGVAPATGTYDLRFTIYNSSSGGSVSAGPLTNSATAVTSGLFTVSLDFGAGVFTGADRWLEIAVRTNGADGFITLSPRQPLTAAPSALYARNVNAAGITGTLPATTLNGIYSNPINLVNGANNFSGTFYGQFFGPSFVGGSFSGDGSGLLNLNAAQISEGTFPATALGNAWRLIGNSGTSETNFIGTTENHALNFRVANVRGFRIEPDPRPGNDSANLIGGSASNRVELPGSGGSVIAGGGFAGGPNLVRSNSSGVFIGGGSANQVGPNANDVVLAGGFGNNVRTYGATIGGGRFNLIQTNSDYAVISGGAENIMQANIGTIGGGGGNTNLGFAATIAGGFYNTVSNNGAFVGGGGLNVAGGFNAAVAGGDRNQATAQNATIGGGFQNRSSGFSATVGGGYFNRATNFYATVPGGIFNLAAGSISFAAGSQAHALHNGAFVWNDSTGVDFFSITNDEFAVRASNGVRFVTSGAGILLNGQPVLTANATNALTLTNPANTINGTFVGNGAGLTNLTAWRLDGNGGTTAGVNFLGTTDNQPVEFKVNQTRALRLEPTIGAPNVIGGAANNSATGQGAAIGGGSQNTNAGNYASIPGGIANRTGGDYALAAGRRAKANHQGAFVWADSTDADFASTASDQFAVRAQNGAVIQAATNGTALELRTGGAIKVTGAGLFTGTPVFIHRAVSANISGNTTTIDHPLCNNDPNAILIITPNWNPGGSGGTYNSNAVGVFYTGTRWAIFNQNSVNMITNSAYNVLIVKQ